MVNEEVMKIARRGMEEHKELLRRLAEK